MANGWWNLWGALGGCVAAYQPIGASSLTASYTNLNTPGKYTATLGTAPTLAIDGWSFTAASSQYLDTQYVVPPSGAIVIRSTPPASANQFLIGSRLTTTFNGVQIVGKNADSKYTYRNGSEYVGTTWTTTTVFAVSGASGYKNGFAETTALTASHTNNQPAYIGALNNSGSPTAYVTARIAAVALYSVTIPAAAVARISIAIQRLPAPHPLDIMQQYMPGAAAGIARKIFGSGVIGSGVIRNG